MHAHNISDVIEIRGWRAFCCCGNLFVLAVPFSAAAALCGWRLGEGECSSQLQLYLCPAVDSPLSAAPLLSQKSIPFLQQPNLSRSLIQIGVILSGGWCLPLVRNDYSHGRWKGKMQMILNLFWGVAPPLAFLHLFISWSHFLFVQGLSGVPLTSHFSPLISFSLDLLSTLHYHFKSHFFFPVHHPPLSVFFLLLAPRSFSVWTTQHRPRVNM